MKLCPLKFGKGVKIEDETYYKCEEEKCAWWESGDGKCIVQVLDNIADGIWNG